MGIDYGVIGSRIRKAREAKGYTQEILAESMDVSNAYISKIERGKTSVNLDNLDKICTILDTSIEHILSGASSSSPNYLDNEIGELLQSCSSSQIRLIARIIQTIVEYEE